MEQTAGDSWKVIQEKNCYGQRKSYLANFRVIWNTEQYTQRFGIVAVMIPVNTVKESMNNVMHMQSMYLLDEQGTVLVSGGNEQAQNLQMPKLQERSRRHMKPMEPGWYAAVCCRRAV